MIVVLCDICRRELEPRGKGQYDWLSKGGVVVLVDGTPARLVYKGRDVDEVCTSCVGRCMARTTMRS
jgi:hypothetical protein